MDDKVLKRNILKTQFMLQNETGLDNSALDHMDMISTLANSNNAHYTRNNTVDIYPKSEEFFTNLKDELKKAQKYINFQFYIFKDDMIGREIIDILIAKAKEGVEVRFLYDAVGGRRFHKESIEKLKASGVKMASFFPSFLKYFNINLNYRNHRKIVVIDNRVGFVGGYNIGDEYLGRDTKFGEWRDTHVKLTGDAVMDLNMRFFLDWRYSSNENLDFSTLFDYEYPDLEDVDGLLDLELDGYKPDHYNEISKKFEYDSCKNSNSGTCANCSSESCTSYKEGVGVQIVSSGPDIIDLDEVKYGYIKIIQKARHYVYIQTPYLILDSSLVDTLKIACLSGVDVRIMLPQKPDHPFVYWATISYAGELLKYGARVYTYNGESGNAFLHAKTMVADDSIASIGTANMDIRSFELNFEVNAFIYSDKKAVELREIFQRDLEFCDEITSEVYNARSSHVKFKESISRLMSSVL
jgi:cardiolipin synthase